MCEEWLKEMKQTPEQGSQPASSNKYLRKSGQFQQGISAVATGTSQLIVALEILVGCR